MSESFEAEIRLVNEEGFHKTILEKTTFGSDESLIAFLKDFDEGRKFLVGVKSGGISASKAFKQGYVMGLGGNRGFFLGYENPTGKVEVVK